MSTHTLSHAHTRPGIERDRFFAGKYDVLGIEPLNPFPETDAEVEDPFVEMFGDNTFTKELMEVCVVYVCACVCECVCVCA